MRFVKVALALGVLAVALAVPLAVLAGGAGKQQTGPIFSFGRTGGNIVPFSVSVSKEGRVTTSGPVSVTNKVTLAQPLRNGLAKLAKAEGFFSMPVAIRCSAVHPDVAAHFVTFSAGGKTRTVTARGGCNAAFEELYAVITAALGAS
jgi:hypothetical protein